MSLHQTSFIHRWSTLAISVPVPELACGTECMQAAYTELQQRCSSLTSEVERMRESASRSPGMSNGPRSVEGAAGGDASARLRQMHDQLAQQEVQLTSTRAENQVRSSP